MTARVTVPQAKIPYSGIGSTKAKETDKRRKLSAPQPPSEMKSAEITLIVAILGLLGIAGGTTATAWPEPYVEAVSAISATALSASVGFGLALFLCQLFRR